VHLGSAARRLLKEIAASRTRYFGPVKKGARARRRLATLSLATVVSVAATAGIPAYARTNGVVDCHVYASYPNVLITSARGMSCGTAAREMRRYRSSIYRRFRTPGGFSCYRVSGGNLGGQWRCVRRSQAFRFDFGD